MLGFIFAILTSIFLSIYVVPKKIVKEKTIYYTTYMTLGFAISAVITYFLFLKLGINKEVVPLNVKLVLIFRGLSWLLSVHFYSVSIDKIGISRSVQYKNIKSPLGIVLSLLVLQEFLLIDMSLVLIATVFTFLSAILLTIKRNEEKKINKAGIIYAILSAVLLAITNVLQKWVTNQGIVYSQHIYTAIASFVFSIIYFVFIEKNIKKIVCINRKNIVYAMCGGIFFFLATFFQSLAYERLTSTVVTIISQLSTVWSILIGIFIFKEIEFVKNWKRIICGIILAILSIVILL